MQSDNPSTSAAAISGQVKSNKSVLRKVWSAGKITYRRHTDFFDISAFLGVSVGGGFAVAMVPTWSNSAEAIAAGLTFFAGIALVMLITRPVADVLLSVIKTARDAYKEAE